MPTLTVTAATKTDVKALQFIARQTFAAAFADQNSEENMQSYLTENLSAEKLLSEINTPGSEFYLARDNNQLVGYLKLNFGQAQTDLQDPKSMEVERIYIMPNYYGKQAGLQLLDFALARARTMKMERVWLGVWEQNHRAIRFYQKHGFKEFARHPFVLGNDVQTDLLMAKQLNLH